MHDRFVFCSFCSLCGALLLLLFFAAAAGHAQSAGEGTSSEALRSAFEAADARAVFQSAAGRVEVGLLGSRSQYSRSQAIYVLQKFFDDHPPDRFAWRDTSTRGQSRSLTGRYWQEGAEQPLQVYLRLSQSGEGEESWHLQEVRVKRL